MKTLLAPDFWTTFRPLRLIYFNSQFILHFTWPASHLLKWRILYIPVLLLQSRYLILSGHMKGGGNEEERGGEQSSLCGKASSESPNHSIQTVLSPCHKQNCREFEAARHTHTKHTHTPKNIFSGCPQECVWSQPAWRCHSPLPVWSRRLCPVAKCYTATFSIKAARHWANSGNTNTDDIELFITHVNTHWHFACCLVATLVWSEAKFNSSINSMLHMSKSC